MRVRKREGEMGTRTWKHLFPESTSSSHQTCMNLLLFLCQTGSRADREEKLMAE